MFPKVPQSSQTESLGFPRVPPPPLKNLGSQKQKTICALSSVVIELPVWGGQA